MTANTVQAAPRVQRNDEGILTRALSCCKRKQNTGRYHLGGAQVHLMPLLRPYELFQMSHLNRSFRAAALNDALWKVHLIERGITQNLNPARSLREHYARRFTHEIFPPKESEEFRCMMMRYTYSIRLNVFNSLIDTSLIITSLFVTAQAPQKALIACAGANIVALTTESLISNRIPLSLSYWPLNRSFQALSGLGCLILSFSGNAPPAASACLFYNGSISVIKTFAGEEFFPDLCTKAVMKTNSLWKGIKRAFL